MNSGNRTSRHIIINVICSLGVTKFIKNKGWLIFYICKHLFPRMPWGILQTTCRQHFKCNPSSFTAQLQSSQLSTQLPPTHWQPLCEARNKPIKFNLNTVADTQANSKFKAWSKKQISAPAEMKGKQEEWVCWCLHIWIFEWWLGSHCRREGLEKRQRHTFKLYIC